jgi:hypothetical protein
LQGGGILDNAHLTVNNCIIRNNTGGGIFNTNVLTLNDSVVSGNHNNSGGGGIENLAFTTATINRTTISGNETTSEGGGLRLGGGTVTVTNSTISGNLAQFIGGGIANRTDATLYLNAVTIAGNTALFGGGGIWYETTSTTSLLGTIIAGNVAGAGGGHPDCLGSGSMQTRGHNLIGKGRDRDTAPFQYQCVILTAGDQIGSEEHPIDPLLGPLTDNGGPTPTRALLAGSPGIDGGDDAGCEAAPVSSIDQRGVNRFAGTGAHCDIGSFEKTSLFTDDPLLPGVTPIKAVHITELRARINATRIGRGLQAYAWTDPTLTPGSSVVTTQHILDLRQALLDVYLAANMTPPTYTDPVLTPGNTLVRTPHIAELRAHRGRGSDAQGLDRRSTWPAFARTSERVWKTALDRQTPSA